MFYCCNILLIFNIFSVIWAYYAALRSKMNKYTLPLLDFMPHRGYNLIMFKNLRIISCVLAVICAAAAIFVFVYAGIAWGFICVAGAVAFFLLTLMFKRMQEDRERKDNPPASSGDFITGRVSTEKKEDTSDKNN